MSFVDIKLAEPGISPTPEVATPVEDEANTS
jgi:hypothetical protein